MAFSMDDKVSLLGPERHGQAWKAGSPGKTFGHTLLKTLVAIKAIAVYYPEPGRLYGKLGTSGESGRSSWRV
jgi:hypothetical protein